MLVSKIALLFLLLAVVVKGSLDYRNSHKRGVAFYGYDWDDHSYEGGGDMEDSGLEEEQSLEKEEKGDNEWIEEEEEEEEDWEEPWEEPLGEEEEEEEGGEEEDWSWKKDEENTDSSDEKKDEEPSQHYHHHKHKHFYPKPYRQHQQHHQYHKPHHHHHHHPQRHYHPHRPIVKVDFVTRSRPHRGNFMDGYSNGFAAGMQSPFNRNHTIEYLHTVTSCGKHKRVDVIDGVSYTFSSLATVEGPITVTKTIVDFDGHDIEIPLTNGEEQLSKLPMDGVTRTVVEVEDETTTLPIRTRRRRQRQPPSDQRQFMQEPPPPAASMEQRLGLDGSGGGWGKVLAVGDDGIRGTVLRNIVYDENGDAIIPKRAGTRKVYIINDKTTTLKNGLPTPFPVDNGHTRTVIALRNGMVTLPLTGADEFTKLLPIEGVTETVVVFDDSSYTLSPDHTDANGQVVHQTVPSQVMRTVVVEEILTKNSAPVDPPVKPPELEAWDIQMQEAARPKTYTLPADLSVPPPLEPRASILRLPVPTEQLVVTNSVLSPEQKSSTLSLPVPTDLTVSTVSPPGPLSILLSSLFRKPLGPIQPAVPAPRHCPTKLILDSKRKSEGCYTLVGLEVIDSEMREVASQGYWTDQSCHSFCEASHRLTNTTATMTSWYYGLTMSTDGGSSTCRCMLNLLGSQISTRCREAPGSLQQRPYHLGEVGDSDNSAIYIYQASYRCLSPSLLKRRRLQEEDAQKCRTTELQSKRASEGCYPYLTPKVTVIQTRRQGEDNWTAATCYSFCLVSGRVPIRASWYYGLTTSIDETTCLCMLEMGAPPKETHCVDLPGDNKNATNTTMVTMATTTKAGVMNRDDLTNAAIYAYKVSYQCPSCTSPKQIGDTMAIEGCYGLADYGAQTIKKITRDLDALGVYTPTECFDLCLNSGLIIPGQAWWYGITQSDPIAVAYHGWTSTTSCRCSIQAPTSPIGSGRCHHAVGLVDDRFLYRVNNGVYVYKVAYQC